jgi:hypothetical protein
MNSSVKYLHRLPGGMLAYETSEISDATVSHTSYASLYAALHRPGMQIVFIHQRNDRIKDEDSYTTTFECRKEGRLAVLYRETPFPYASFQG